MTDIFSKDERSRIMATIKSKNTKAELVLRKELFRLGIRYRVSSRKIFGKPDIAIKKYRLAIFIDGDWWHGRNYEIEFRRYPDFWKQKILKNIERDKIVNKTLKSDKWIVLRYWQKDVEKDYEKIAEQIAMMINRSKS